jgi:hypothetical protein
MFDALTQLQKQLRANALTVVHAGHTWTASFEWSAPARLAEILETEKQLAFPIPDDYRKFLAESSDGALLFVDREFGQWGYRLFGITEMAEKQEAWKKSLPATWDPNLLAFGELLGEANVLVFDMTKPTENASSYTVLEANAYERSKDWPVLSRSFHEWLDHLITAQGDKYWSWL